MPAAVNFVCLFATLCRKKKEMEAAAKKAAMAKKTVDVEAEDDEDQADALKMPALSSSDEERK